jgi:hypothetical protein
MKEFQRMQKLAGLITESEYKSKIEEFSLSGMASKVKDKIVNLPAFKNLIDTIVSNMDEKDIATFKSRFNLSEAQGGMSFDNIMKKVNSANPEADNDDNEEMINEELDPKSFGAKIASLVRNLTGINLLALAGAPLGLLITTLAGWSWAALPLGIVISLVVSLIIHGISSRLLGKTGDDSMIGENVIEAKKAPKGDILNAITPSYTGKLADSVQALEDYLKTTAELDYQELASLVINIVDEAKYESDF